ncbi:nitroreductase family protein [Alicyclobacillus fastidiosus]|uniref:Nitroreductase family protein n=1 Tax=Alicyclobacillus fastidiosus TaxID=392011 RepID=A0ABV5AJH5_9BACL|nr:nitroreductase family protein [Alicyclobacillus fastidiosus]WEH08278.1 nitroreductase family protein [Alicyclobacillus fastidiosus]
MARHSDYPIDELFLNRWSPRAFAEKKVPTETLYSILEAARFAPSASNFQPWRFVIAQTDEELETFAEFILPGNRLWTDHKVPVLILLLSDKYRPNGEPNPYHSFDAGAAWQNLALQAHKLGLVTHAMGGFDKAKARELLQIPEQFEVLTLIALGYQGDKNELPEQLQEREMPNDRRPLSESIVSFK